MVDSKKPKALDDLLREAARLSQLEAKSSSEGIAAVTASVLSNLVQARRAARDAAFREANQRQMHIAEGLPFSEGMAAFRRFMDRGGAKPIEHGRPWITVAEAANVWRCTKPTARKALRHFGVLRRLGNKDVVAREQWAGLSKMKLYDRLGNMPWERERGRKRGR